MKDGQDRWWEDRQPDFVSEKKPAEYWARQMDADRIRSKNWSRRYKRNKKLWRTTEGRGSRSRMNTTSADAIRKLAEEGR